MEFYRIWQILISNKWLLIWLPLVAAGFGLGLTYVLPELYEATALVLVRPFEDIKFNSSGGGEKKEMLDFPVNLSAPIDAPSKTYMEVIKSPAVATKIVEALQLDVEQPKQYGSAFEATKDKFKSWIKNTIRTVRNYSKYGRDIPASRFDMALEGVQSSLVVAARKDTYAFDITFRSGDPREAAAVANMAAEIFLAQSSEAYRSESARARGFIEAQLDQSRKALEEARAAKLAYEKEGGTFELNSEYKEKLKNVEDLENTLAKDEGKLAGLKRTRIEGSPSVFAEEAEIAELKRQISAVRAQLATCPAKETRMNPVALNESLAQKSYEFFLKNYEEARVKESETATEIRIVSRAVPALYPIKPVKYVYVGLSFAMGLVVAIAWALFVESLDPRVRMIRDLDDEFGVPVLGGVATPVLGTIPRLRRSWWTVGT
jgi:uncharacterized protein involved in exopolysaccharide biosynthesis